MSVLPLKADIGQLRSAAGCDVIVCYGEAGLFDKDPASITRQKWKRPPTEAALLWLLTDDPGDEPSTTPKLNCGAFENLLGFFDSFAVVLANEAPVPNKTFLTSDEIGPVILHGAAPLY
jgi:hypothetical protein